MRLAVEMSASSFFQFCFSKIQAWMSLGLRFLGIDVVTLGAKGLGFQWEHVGHTTGIGTLCPAFTQWEHSIHIWNVIQICTPNVPIGNILFTAGMRPCHVSDMYLLRTFQVLLTYVCKIFPAYTQVGMLWVHAFCLNVPSTFFNFLGTFRILFKMN
jgi:hypothetical protein